MNKVGFCIRAYITAILVMTGFFSGMAQTIVTGYVKDSATQAPLSNASVSIKGSGAGPARIQTVGSGSRQTRLP